MLSIAMVVKNEALTIERSIESVAAYADEVVVGLDSRSDDGTEEIVRRLATQVVPINLSDELAAKHSLDDDPDWGFAKARNKVLNACSQEAWHFTLDGHETVLNPAELAGAIKAAEEGAYTGVEVTIMFEPAADGIPDTMYASKRLLAPEVRYRNPNHNAPYVTRRNNARHILVEHRKCDQAQDDKLARDEQRAGANIPGLRAKVEAEPGNSRAWYYLGSAYRENRIHSEAIAAFKRCLLISRFDEERWQARISAGLCHCRIGETVQAREQFVAAAKERPCMAETFYYLGDLAYKERKYKAAEGWLRKCCELEMPECRLFLKPRVYLVGRYDLLSMVYHYQGRYADAIEVAKQALKAAPNERIETNIDIWGGYIMPTSASEAMPRRKLVHYSRGMSFFGARLERVYGFTKYSPPTDLTRPVFFASLYFPEDYALLEAHQGSVSVFWNGSDVTRMLRNPEWKRIASSKPTKHFCHNAQLRDELAAAGINAAVHPIFFSDAGRYTPSFKPSETPQVYMVAHPGREEEYGVSDAVACASRVGVTVHVYGVDGESTGNVQFHGQVDEEVMDSEIVHFQGCLRLNKHDGFSQTLMKSILLAQYPICRQDIPGALRAATNDELIDRLSELKTKTEPNLALRDRYVKQFSTMPDLDAFKSGEYWNNRYLKGGNSGSGSYGKLAQFKADVINDFVEKNQVQSAIELGCGDGNQLGLFAIPSYIGTDVSAEALRICSEKFKADASKVFLSFPGPATAELALSLDVIFHLVEDDVYYAYMAALFQAASRFVIIYSSNFEKRTAAHEREREFTKDVSSEWELIEKIRNPWPYPECPDGSLSDFYIYAKKQPSV